MPGELLICDDNTDTLNFLTLAITKQSDWRVHPAESALEARDIIAARRIDAALIDLAMDPQFAGADLPDEKSGLQLARHLRDTTPEAFIILMTGAAIHLKSKVEESGFGFLVKPFDIRHVIDWLNSTSREATNTRSAAEPINFLIVDDNSGFLGFIRRVFSREPALNCFTAETAEQAKEIIAERRLDAALIDCKLPDASGIEVAELLRDSAFRTVITLMSGDPSNKVLADRHAFDFLDKPFLAPPTIRNIVQKVIRTTKSLGAIDVFYSYSHKDERLRRELENHLITLERTGVINGWSDRNISAGGDIDASIDLQLERADVFLLLVSADFMASPFCYEREMQRAIERHLRNEARVVPIILRPVDWHDAPFGRLLALPDDGRPVTKWPDRADAFVSITKGIKRLVAELRSARGIQS